MFDRLVFALGAGALALTAAAPVHAQDAEAPLTVIHAGQLLAAPGEARVRREVSILVRGDQVEAIESGYVTPDGAEIVDLSGAFVMPGFIDAHVHITNQQGPGRRISAFTEGPADRAIDGVLYAGRRCAPASPPFRTSAETSRRCGPCATGSRTAISSARACASPAER